MEPISPYWWSLDRQKVKEIKHVNLMKKITSIAIAIAFSYAANAQNRIDDKYKMPERDNSKTSTFLKPPFNKDLLVRVYGKSQSDKVFDKCQAEYDAFNQNGDEVWIYADEFFNGEKKILKVGDYTLLGSANSRQLGTNWNDRISSMLIPTSLKLTLFMDDKFTGLSTQTAGFGVINMETGTKGFKGDYYSFKSQGKYSKGGLYFVSNQAGTTPIEANDQISSLKIYN